MAQKTCPHCDAPFEGANNSKYCSFECSVLSRIQKGADNQCWPWTAGKSRDGYGSFERGRKKWKAHRVSYEIHVGPIPEGLYVLHKCDNPPCCNPVHLFLGTQADNVADKVAKGRQSRGSDRPTSKLFPADVYEIRYQLESGKISQQALAEAYKVSANAIWEIDHRKSWKHLPENESDYT